MAIGDPITSPIPPVGRIGPTYASEANALFTELVTAVEADVPFSALSGDELDMDNSPITNAQYLELEPQAVTPASTPAGRIEYFGGEFWFINDYGAIQATSVAALNASAIGGIGGDYGGANPASVRFVDASLRYEFYDNYAGAAWGYVRARGFDIAAGAVSAVFAQLRYAGAATATFTFPATLPGADRSLVTISSTGQLEHNTVTNTITNDVYLGTGDRIREFGKIKTFVPNFNRDFLEAGTWSAAAGGAGVVFTATNSSMSMNIEGFNVGETITSITVRIDKQDTTNLIWIFQRVQDGVITAVKTSAVTGGTGYQSITDTLSHVVLVNNSYKLFIIGGVAVNDSPVRVDVTYNT